ncbi:hypothetical protein PF006_g13418 [Phytophthora fragariae]|uniref:Uncharacterized protein n=1 Tax=Phytophthora fragariae TaxID=53985 RepID=A0A6A3TR12_9STRA|nr:hypothetical protein PF006_g13418 [Phytophthora fragariae]
MSKPESNQKSSYTPETMSPKSTTSSTPESGTSDEFLEFEGTTSIAPAPSPTYRYCSRCHSRVANSASGSKTARARNSGAPLS